MRFISISLFCIDWFLQPFYSCRSKNIYCLWLTNTCNWIKLSCPEFKRKVTNHLTSFSGFYLCKGKADFRANPWYQTNWGLSYLVNWFYASSRTISQENFFLKYISVFKITEYNSCLKRLKLRLLSLAPFPPSSGTHWPAQELNLELRSHQIHESTL